MELKLVKYELSIRASTSSNRTFMELKYELNNISEALT